MGEIRDLANLWRQRQEFDPAATDHPGWRLNNLTTTQRDALTGSGAAKAGDIIYNTTTKSVETYSNGAWIGVSADAANVGTVTTAATTAVKEYGDGLDHITKLTMTSFAVGTIPDNAALAFGASFYTLPAGAIYIAETTISGSLTGAVSVTAQTPEVGIGTVIASGANATLTTATWEQLVDGGAAGGTVDAVTVAPDINGTAFNKANLSTARPIIKASGGAARELFLNVAATWADVAATGALTFTGVITIRWRKIS